MTATSIHPFLMFEGRAEEAMRFDLSVFPDGRIDRLVRYAAGQPGPEGSVARAAFTIAQQPILCTDSFVKHGFTFTPATSMFVEGESEAQIDRIWAALCEGGTALMPLGPYPFSRRFGWLNDRFGVSWQLNLQ
jgi:predicted 3-demethylubiquinone-9 3-methyltransferase (glyoxalase superfamily)